MLIVFYVLTDKDRNYWFETMDFITIPRHNMVICSEQVRVKRTHHQNWSK